MIGVLVRGRNCRKYLAKCLRSIARQTYQDWQILLVLDDPTDGVEKILPELVALLGIQNKIVWKVRETRKGLSYNMFRGVVALKHCDIVAIVDADDWISKDALKTVVNTYRKHDCLVTHGSYLKESKRKRTRISKAYPKGCDVMKARWRGSHLKTLSGSVAGKVRPEWFKHNGKWLPAASDVALMLPLMSMVGMNRVRHIHKVIYHYRDQTPHKTQRELQKKCEAIVRGR